MTDGTGPDPGLDGAPGLRRWRPRRADGPAAGGLGAAPQMLSCGGPDLTAEEAEKLREQRRRAEAQREGKTAEPTEPGEPAERRAVDLLQGRSSSWTVSRPASGVIE
ncbi:hypothetical protein [Couchioplanes caeruleus]|nr:hypothetical protein [Couchioplanes caeruleus]ROP29857.1 hypothetical protein EDD30_2678 [Couchioplanes caeruleus]